ncbi:MAG: hypothetical protein IKF01_04765 [Bacilli bacterium]|nr:hypothetical protein [Bacilli bacterium]
MKYKKNYRIEGKIVKKSDLINLVESILDKYSKSREITVNIEAQFNDGTVISDSDVSIFENIYFEKLVLQKIYIFIRTDYNNGVSITIYSDRDYSDATIESDDSNLYGSICNCIKENIDLMEKQKELYLLSSKTLGYVVIIIAILAFEILIGFVIENLFKIKIPTVLIYIMVLVIPNIVPIFTVKYIEKYFPINQFYFGDSSINKPNLKNSFLYKLIVFIVINLLLPVILGYLTK